MHLLISIMSSTTSRLLITLLHLIKPLRYTARNILLKICSKSKDNKVILKKSRSHETHRLVRTACYLVTFYKCIL